MFVRNNILGLIWTIFIFIVCLIPGDNLPESSFFGDFPIDKVIHFGFYFVLFVLVYSGILKQGLKHGKVMSIAYCIVVGIAIELIQTFVVSERSGDVLDVVSNILGTLFGVMSYKLIESKISFLRKKA